MLIQIPFSGFYCSLHDELIDHELQHAIFTDRQTGCHNNDGLSERAYDKMNWKDLHEEYAAKYAKNFAYEFGLNLTFVEMTSPREYNFTTDRIFCDISEEDMLTMFDETTKITLAKWAKKMFTSYDGFHSFYSNDFLDWGDIRDGQWDCNHLYCLLCAWLDDVKEVEKVDEYAIMEDSFGNGFLSELIYTHCTDKRVFTVLDYLHERLERSERQVRV